MSNSTINFNNIAYTNGSDTIIVGDIEINTVDSHAIDIKPIGSQVPSHIILSKNDDIIFKTIIQSSPISNFDISIYDHHGHKSCYYKADRTNNLSGNVEITESKNLLSNIDFPKIDDGQMYMVITHYEGIEQLYAFESKRELVNQDLELLKQKVNTHKIILFISDKINNVINTLGINLSDTFQKVISHESHKLINYMGEYLFGKKISGSKPSFQGMLKINSKDGNLDDVNIGMVRFINYDSTIPGVTNTIRRNGRIQINTTFKTTRSRFFIRITHPINASLTVCEETTNTTFVLTPRTPENILDVTDEHFDIIIKSLNFLENLYITKDQDEKLLIKFIKQNLCEAGKYLFDSPLVVFKEIESKSDISNMIIEYGCIIHNQIYQILFDNILSNNRNIKINNKSMFFTERDFRPQNTTNHYLYNTNNNFMVRNYTQEQVSSKY
jgi:hypothetical protein